MGKMSLVRSMSLAATAALLMSIGLPASAAPTFEIGDAPPPLEPMAWIKGGPVSRFEPGHVYVVTFFTTWCGASNESMPQMSELARRHVGRLTVIGVNVRETERGRGEGTVAALRRFVAKKGDDIDYIVAMDDQQKKTLFDSWMLAAGAYGTPTAFIIGKDGKLAYLGYPTDHRASYPFTEALDKALAGKSDLAAARALQSELSEQTVERLEEVKLLAPMEEALLRKDYRAVIAEADKVIAQHPSYEWRLFSDKLSALLQLDERKAMDFALRRANDAELRKYLQARDEVEFRGRIGSMIAREQGVSDQLYQQAAGYLQEAAAAHSDDLGSWVMLARVQHRFGNLAHAIDAQRQAIALASRNQNIPSGVLNEMQNRLADYERERAASSKF
jgi:thiol-disulfide isomerase/thioredoxin